MPQFTQWHQHKYNQSARIAIVRTKNTDGIGIAIYKGYGIGSSQLIKKTWLNSSSFSYRVREKIAHNIVHMFDDFRNTEDFNYYQEPLKIDEWRHSSRPSKNRYYDLRTLRCVGGW